MNNVPPTRQELLILKKKKTVASRSKKLLEDKRNSLIKQFMLVIAEAIEARRDFDDYYVRAYNMLKASSEISSPAYFQQLPQMSNSKVEFSVNTKNVLSVSITEFLVENIHVDVAYSKVATNLLLDKAIEEMKSVVYALFTTIEKEYAARSLSEEIIKTRRRVNSLEHVLLPEMTQSISDIEFKLAELAQSMTVMLMRVKSKMN